MKPSHLNSKLFALSIVIAASFSCCAVSAQTAADVENVVRNSKGVDKSRPVRAIISGKITTISTYCHAKASDQDCKINSLFIMKDLLQHYKTIHHLQISFFDPNIANVFRTVDVTEGDAALVDGGKPVQDVLSQMDITHGKLAAARRPGQASLSSSPLSTPARSASSDLKEYNSADGDVSIMLPASWLTYGARPGYLLVCGAANNQIMLARHDLLPIISFEDTVRNMEAACSKSFNGWRQVKEEQRSVRGGSGIVQKGTFEPNSTLRAFYLKGRDHLYILSYIATGGNDGENELLFSRLLASLSVKG